MESKFVLSLAIIKLDSTIGFNNNFIFVLFNLLLLEISTICTAISPILQAFMCILGLISIFVRNLVQTKPSNNVIHGIYGA